MTDADLLAHYLARGAESWNVSLESAWLDYELRRFVLAYVPARRPLAVCNVGIGVGLWDDWLARVLGGAITSVDRDPEICRVFAYRQLREEHPFPSCVICGDVRDDVLGDARFDIVTCVGSTLDESGDRDSTWGALERLLVSGGRLLTAECGAGAARVAADHVRTCGDLWLACSTYRAARD